MNTDNHENPTLSILSGSIVGLISFFAEHGFILDFGLDLLKVMLFGVAGGICGKLGGHLYNKYIHKKIR
jgi:hypothetical protein